MKSIIFHCKSNKRTTKQSTNLYFRMCVTYLYEQKYVGNKAAFYGVFLILCKMPVTIASFDCVNCSQMCKLSKFQKPNFLVQSYASTKFTLQFQNKWSYDRNTYPCLSGRRTYVFLLQFSHVGFVPDGWELKKAWQALQLWRRKIFINSHRYGWIACEKRTRNTKVLLQLKERYFCTSYVLYFSAFLLII